MANKSTDQDENQPFDYLRKAKSAQEEKSNISNIVTSIRADMLPATEEQPARKSIFQQENLKIAVGIWFGIVILALIWYILAGPGRPVMERNLASLAHRETTPTQTITPSPFPATNTQPQPSNTPQPSATMRPTNTAVVVLITSPIYPPMTATPTSTGCREALSITLADVGQTMCVQGIVIETVTNPTDFMVIFSNERGAFYWVTYDLVWSKAELDTCYQVQGTIDRIGNSPILIFGYQNLPEVCP
ncbi:MAG: hypothetical protein WAV05_01315 [Anaerolineales bacterium]